MKTAIYNGKLITPAEVLENKVLVLENDRIIDEQVIENVSEYLNEKHIQLRVTKLNYIGILKEGYIVNLILGGLFALLSLGFTQIQSLMDIKIHRQKKLTRSAIGKMQSGWENIKFI